MAVETPPDPPTSQKEAEREKTLPPIPPNLLAGPRCNVSDSKGYSHSAQQNTDDADGEVRNTAAVIAAGKALPIPCPRQLGLDIQATLERARTAEAILKAQQAEKYRQQRQRQTQAVHRAQLEAWRKSGDAVLEAEAHRQLERLEQKGEPDDG